MNNDQIRCNEDELIQLLRLSIAIEIVPVPDDLNAETDVGPVRNSTRIIKIYEPKLYTIAHRQRMNFMISMQDNSTRQLLNKIIIPLLLWPPLLMMRSGLLHWL